MGCEPQIQLKIFQKMLLTNLIFKTDHGRHERVRGDQHGPDHLVSPSNLQSSEEADDV